MWKFSGVFGGRAKNNQTAVYIPISIIREPSPHWSCACASAEALRSADAIARFHWPEGRSAGRQPARHCCLKSQNSRGTAHLSFSCFPPVMHYIHAVKCPPFIISCIFTEQRHAAILTSTLQLLLQSVHRVLQTAVDFHHLIGQLPT